MLAIKKFLFFSALAITQFASANIVEIYETAKEYDPDYKISYFTHKINLEKHPAALANLLPTLSFSASSYATRNKSQAEGATSSIVSYNYHKYGINLTQPIFNLSSFLGLGIAELQEQQSKLSLASAEQNLILKVTTEYFNVLLAYDELFFTKLKKNSFEKRLEETKQKHKVSIASITDVHESQARFDSAVADQITAENNLINAKDKFRQITGKNITLFKKLKDEIEFVAPTPSDSAHWVKASVNNNLDIKISEHQTQIDKKNIKISSSEHYPILNLTSDLSKSTSGATQQTVDTSTGTIGFSLSFNLFSGGSISSKTRVAMEKYNSSEVKHYMTVDKISNVARSSYRGIISSISRIKAFKQLVTSTQESLNATEAAYSVGTRTIIDVLDAQNNLFDAKKNYAKARYEYIIQSLALKQAVGSLDIKDIMEVQNWLT